MDDFGWTTTIILVEMLFAASGLLTFFKWFGRLFSSGPKARPLSDRQLNYIDILFEEREVRRKSSRRGNR